MSDDNESVGWRWGFNETTGNEGDAMGRTTEPSMEQQLAALRDARAHREAEELDEAGYPLALHVSSRYIDSICLEHFLRDNVRRLDKGDRERVREDAWRRFNEWDSLKEIEQMVRDAIPRPAPPKPVSEYTDAEMARIDRVLVNLDECDRDAYVKSWEAYNKELARYKRIGEIGPRPLQPQGEPLSPDERSVRSARRRQIADDLVRGRARVVDIIGALLEDHSERG